MLLMLGVSGQRGRGGHSATEDQRMCFDGRVRLLCARTLIAMFVLCTYRHTPVSHFLFMQDNDNDGLIDCDDPDCANNPLTASHCHRCDCSNPGPGVPPPPQGGRGGPPLHPHPTAGCNCPGFSHVNCRNMSDVYYTSRLCGSVNNNDRTFCRSQCYYKLHALMANCGTQLPASVLTDLFDPAVMAMLGSCAGHHPGGSNQHQVHHRDSTVCGQSTFLQTMMSTCAGSQIAQQTAAAQPDYTQLCTDTCMVTLMDCVDSFDRITQMALTQTHMPTVARIAEIKSVCLHNVEQSTAGDGVCDSLGPSIERCVAQHHTEIQHLSATTCRLACVQEGFDCLNAPNNPLTAATTAALTTLSGQCSTQQNSCSRILITMSQTLAPCCPTVADCANSVPTTCSTACANMFVPMYNQCAVAIDSAGLNQDNMMSNFANLCIATMSTAGGGAH
jgi:hypothetical protein